MAKGQKRSNKEIRKPKSKKKEPDPTTNITPKGVVDIVKSKKKP